MIRPTQRSVLIVVASLPVAVLPALIDPRLWVSWVALVLALSGLGALDGLLLAPRRALRVEVEAPRLVYVGDRDTLRVVLGLEGVRAAVELELVAELDELLERQSPLRLRLRPGEERAAAVPLVPLRRGRALVRALHLRARGPLGLAERTWREEVGTEVTLAPNVGAVRAAALELFAPHSSLAGTRARRHLGDGTEFESLGHFVAGLDSRAIDWKSSAKHRQLLCRVYRAERDHQVVLAFDRGRLMREPLEGLTRLDHAVNAGLVLGYVCLRTGDRVGLYEFDSAAGSLLAPQRGARAFPRLLERAAGLEYTSEETNFTLGMTELSSRLRRRSLVVVFTEFVDSISAELMVSNLARLGRRHLVVFVALQDPELRALAEADPRDLPALGRAVIASDLLRERQLVLRRLDQAGVHCVDARAAELAPQLLSRYLEIKRRELVG